MLTTRRANQQCAVTKKGNIINDLSYRPNLTFAESEKLATLTREINSDKQELENRNQEMRVCSENEAKLILEIGRLKMKLNNLENDAAISFNYRSSYRR